MKCHVEVVRPEHVSALPLLLNEFYVLTEAMLRHQLFANPGYQRLGSSGAIAGAVIVDEAGGLQGFMATYPMELYAGQQPVAGCHWGVLYVREFCRDYLMDLVQFVLDANPAAVIYTNTSNASSVRICKALRFRFAETAYRYKYLNIFSPVGLLRISVASKVGWLAVLKPLDWLWRITLPRDRKKEVELEYRRLYEIDSTLFATFNARLIAANCGLLSSRDPAYLQWLFGARLATAEFILLGCFQNRQLDGYILLQKGKSGGGSSKARIADWVALGADRKILGYLLEAARKFALQNDIAQLHLNGFPAAVSELLTREFRFRLRKKGVPCSCLIRDQKLRQGLTERLDDSWFFAPYDGDALF